MAEIYQFLRYYLPGSLLLIYSSLFIVPFIDPNTFIGLSLDKMIAVLVGLLGANYAIGYIVYIPFNYKYEKLAVNPEKRPSLKLIALMAKKEGFDNYLRCGTQKKEFLDLVYHSNIETTSNLKIHPEIVNTLKNHLSNYAARHVCGTYVPIAIVPVVFLTLPLLTFVGISFQLSNFWFVFPTLIMVLAISVSLSIDRERVLNETFVLEELMVKAKAEEVKELMKRLMVSEDKQSEI